MGFYFVTTGWILEIGLCVNSINQSIKIEIGGLKPNFEIKFVPVTLTLSSNIHNNHIIE